MFRYFAVNEFSWNPIIYLLFIGYKGTSVDNLNCTLNKLPGSFHITELLRISFVLYPVLNRLIGNLV